jgi:hypothetical protein
VADTVDDSVPASDPPAWTTGGSKSVAARADSDDHRDEGSRRAGGQAGGWTDTASRMAQDAYEAGSRSYSQGRSTVTEGMRDHPWIALVVAGAVGFTVARLFRGERSSSHRSGPQRHAYGKRPPLRRNPSSGDREHADVDLRTMRRQADIASTANDSY